MNKGGIAPAKPRADTATRRGDEGDWGDAAKIAARRAKNLQVSNTARIAAAEAIDDCPFCVIADWRFYGALACSRPPRREWQSSFLVLPLRLGSEGYARDVQRPGLSRCVKLTLCRANPQGPSLLRPPLLSLQPGGAPVPQFQGAPQPQVPRPRTQRLPHRRLHQPLHNRRGHGEAPSFWRRCVCSACFQPRLATPTSGGT